MRYVVLVQATNVYIWTILEPLDAASPEEAGRKAFARDPRLRGRVLLAFPADTAATVTSDGTVAPYQGRRTIREHYATQAPEIGDVSEFDEPTPARPALRLLPGGKLPENPHPKETS